MQGGMLFAESEPLSTIGPSVPGTSLQYFIFQGPWVSGIIIPIVWMVMGSAKGRGLLKFSQESLGEQGLSSGVLQPCLAQALPEPNGREPRGF